MTRKADKRKPAKVSRRGGRVTAPANILALALQRHQAHPTPKTAVELAALYYTHGLESQVLDVLEPFAGHGRESEAAEDASLCALLALGYAHADRLIDAESTAQRLVKHDHTARDGWYVLCFVHLSMREYDRAITAATSYLASPAADKSHPAPIRSFCSSKAHRSQLCNMLASAYRESGRLDEAEAMYREAITADAGNHLPYLNLVNLLNTLERRDEAADILKKGLRSARQIHELRMLSASGSSRSTVSACMIVKNEEELLPDCLASIRDWVDEIILVDTGSTDRTVDIARSYGAKVFHHAWEGDFSKARNVSLSHATGDWIFIIDADERIYTEDVPQLKRLLEDSRTEVISINVYNVYADQTSVVTFLPSTRLFRRSLGLYYDGIVHNTLMYPESQSIVRTGVRLKHLGYGLDKEKMTAKLRRSRELLEKQLAENPDNAFALFNYGQLLRGETATFPAHNAELIITSARRAVDLTSPDLAAERHLHLMCLDQIAWALFHQGKYDQAEEHARRAISHKPNYLDPLLLLGHIAARRQQYDQARVHYAAYLKAQAAYDPVAETDNIIMLHVDSRISAWYSLGMIAEIQGDPDQARRHYELIIERDPAYLETNAHLGRLAFQRHDLPAAEHWYRRHVNEHSDSIEGYGQLGQVLVARQQMQAAVEVNRQGLANDSRDVGCLIGLGRAEAGEGRYHEAVQSFQQVL
ncbi:MAG: glycosyltransferase, partial [candidate division Zixibacteria bacterium]|nr:glycosyltransferase [candidate division Zixibacteria bacterium]